MVILVGWGSGMIQGKDVGYLVPDVCNHESCMKRIDRGLAHACGGYPGESEYSCDGFFCSEHLFFPGEPLDHHGAICKSCLEKL